MVPSFEAVDTAKELLSEAVAQRIRDEACRKAQALIAEAHRSVIFSILWQNMLLLLSLIPVYIIKQPWPFYAAYALVFAYSAVSLFKFKGTVGRLVQTRSITQTLSLEVLDALEAELTQRQFYERKVVEWLGPDLRKLADEVAQKLRGDVIAAACNMGMTLFMAFIAFRVFVIPMLEHRALMS